LCSQQAGAIEVTRGRLTLQSLIKLLASDATIQALANFGGALALVLLCWSFAKRGFSFAAEVWRSSISGAVRNAVKRRNRFVLAAATDVHIFISTIGAICSRIALIVVAMLFVGTYDSFRKYGSLLGWQMVEKSTYGKASSAFLVLMALIAMIDVSRLHFFCVDVNHRRWKLLRSAARIQRRAVNAAPRG